MNSRHEVEDAPRVLLRHHSVNYGVLGGIWEQKRSELGPLSKMVVMPMRGGRSWRLKAMPLLKASGCGRDDGSSASG